MGNRAGFEVGHTSFSPTLAEENFPISENLDRAHESLAVDAALRNFAYRMAHATSRGWAMLRPF